MQIDKKYQIHKLCSGDDARLIINHVWVKRVCEGGKKHANGRAMATNGYMVGWVPCTLDDDDILGPIPVAALTMAYKGKKDMPARLHLQQDFVEAMLTGVLFPRFHELKQTDVPPDPSYIFEGDWATNGQSPPLSMNTNYAQRLQQAFGSDGLVFRPMAKTLSDNGQTAYFVSPSNRFGPPYGAIMPRHL